MLIVLLITPKYYKPIKKNIIKVDGLKTQLKPICKIEFQKIIYLLVYE